MRLSLVAQEVLLNAHELIESLSILMNVMTIPSTRTKATWNGRSDDDATGSDVEDEIP